MKFQMTIQIVEMVFSPFILTKLNEAGDVIKRI